MRGRCLCLALALWWCGSVAVTNPDSPDQHHETKQVMLTSKNNGILVVVLALGYILRSLVYIVLPRVDFEEHDSPVWLKNEYITTSMVQRFFHSVMEERDVFYTPREPFSPQYFFPQDTIEELAFNIKTTGENTNTTRAEVEADLKRLRDLASTLKGKLAEQARRYSRLVERDAGYEYIADLVNLVKVTEENIVAVVDYYSRELFHNLGELLKGLKRRYSTAKPIGSRGDIVTMLDKVFGFHWKMCNNPGLLGNTIEGGIIFPTAQELLRVAVVGIRLMCLFGQPQHDDITEEERVKLNLILKGLKENDETGAREDATAKYDISDLSRVLAIYEVQKGVLMVEYILRQQAERQWRLAQKRMEAFIEAYRRTTMNSGVSHSTLDLETLKTIARTRAADTSGVPLGLLKVIRNLGWERKRQERQDPSEDQSYWNEFWAFFGFNADYEVSVPGEDDSMSKYEEADSQYLTDARELPYSQDLHLPTGESYTHPPPTQETHAPTTEGEGVCGPEKSYLSGTVVQGPPPVEVRSGEESVTSAFINMRSFYEVGNLDLVEMLTLTKVTRSVVKVDSWEEARVALYIPEDLLTRHEHYSQNTSTGLTGYAQLVKCVSGDVCLECDLHAKFESGMTVCCYGCLSQPHLTFSGRRGHCACFYLAEPPNAEG